MARQPHHPLLYWSSDFWPQRHIGWPFLLKHLSYSPAPLIREFFGEVLMPGRAYTHPSDEDLFRSVQGIRY